MKGTGALVLELRRVTDACTSGPPGSFEGARQVCYVYGEAVTRQSVSVLFGVGEGEAGGECVRWCWELLCRSFFVKVGLSEL